jgi:hypothetical protein
MLMELCKEILANLKRSVSKAIEVTTKRLVQVLLQRREHDNKTDHKENVTDQTVYAPMPTMPTNDNKAGKTISNKPL